jgi:very-short-patch-repair endonuclease
MSDHDADGPVDPTANQRLPRVIRAAPIDARKLALARSFRKNPTPAEAAAWRLLRGSKIHGLKFRRQQIIAGFLVDFSCAPLRLVLELDGGVHRDPAQREHDAIRTQILEGLAIRLVRLENNLVDEHHLRRLLAPYAAPASPDHPHRHDTPSPPLPEGEGDGG